MEAVIAAIASCAVGALRGGDLRAVGRQQWHRGILPILAFAVQAVAFLPDENASSLSRSWAAWAHILSYALLVAFVWANRDTPWLWLIGCGLGANALVIVVNGGFMPILPHVPPSSSPAVSSTAEVFNHMTLMREGTRLAFLGDILRTPGWFPVSRAFSVGDVMIAGGAFAMIQRLMVRRAPPRITGTTTPGPSASASDSPRT